MLVPCSCFESGGGCLGGIGSAMIGVKVLNSNLLVGVGSEIVYNDGL